MRPEEPTASTHEEGEMARRSSSRGRVSVTQISLGPPQGRGMDLRSPTPPGPRPAPRPKKEDKIAPPARKPPGGNGGGSTPPPSGSTDTAKSKGDKPARKRR